MHTATSVTTTGGAGESAGQAPSNAQLSQTERTPGAVIVALTGNPNSGKTSLFNALTGAHQHVANWGGVTVEVKEGAASMGAQKVTVIDLPGTYSLTAYSLEERVARDYIIERRPQVVVDVIDATNLERNLYLTVQLLELGIRPILALNMWDEVQAKGIRIDIELLSKLLDVTVVTTVARTGANARKLLFDACAVARSRTTTYRKHLAYFPREIEAALEKLSRSAVVRREGVPAKWLATKLLENDSQVVRELSEVEGGVQLVEEARSAASKIESVLGEDTESLIAEARYGFIAGAIRQVVRKSADRKQVSDQIDRVLTHPVWAYPIFLLFVWVLFQATFALGAYPVAWIESLFSLMSSVVSGLLPEGALRGLIVDGIIGGVGGVAVFLPNILILFLGIAILEDTGYMARAAFIMDKIMQRVGLHGKSFIPLLMGLGCNVPAIMAARTLESERERVKTALLAPLVSCSARLPVYVLFASTLFPRHAGNIVFLFQFVLGTAAFFLMAWIFKKTVFRGEEYPFVMELPPYRLPTLRSVAIHMWLRAQHFLKKMGGVVLVFSVVVWFLGNYPQSNDLARQLDSGIAAVDNDTSLGEPERQRKIRGLRETYDVQRMKHTWIGRIGTVLEPGVKPLGFDWRGAVSLVTGFVAKEIVVSSMGVLYGISDDGSDDGESMRRVISANFTPLTGFCFMLFVLLYTPCVVALVTVQRELHSMGWAAFSVLYQLGLAWVVCFAVYQGGRLLGLE